MLRDLSRREFLRVGGGALLGASALGLAGCGGGGQQGSGGNTLEFWAFDEGRANLARAAIKTQEWKDAHGDIKVNFRIFPYEQMHDKLLTALVSGKGAPDVADVEISRFSNFIKGDELPFVDLKDRIGDDINDVYKPAATDPWTWQGKIYGVGNELNTCVLAYRQDVMDQAGVQTPFETWDQVVEAGRKISNDERKMFALHDLAFGDHYMLSQSAGTAYFDDQGDYIGDNEQSVAALQFLHDMVYDTGIAGIAPAVASDNWYPPQYRAAFKAERFVALFGPPWHLSFLFTDVPDQSGKWRVQKLPSGLGEGLPTANFGGTGQCVTTQSQNVDVAYDLVRISNLTTEGVMADFRARTAYPAYKPAYEEPELQKPNEYFGGQKIGQIYSELAPGLPPFNQAPVWGQATEALVREAITPVMQDKTDAQTALSDLRETVEGMKQG
ncbi:MAG: extracellular solute-binding protein [Actinomycetota bacterium]|jgi:arabinosaccharide transport system substrate-binding protein|nr:extracellular solute-binding protein [Actinomycetota bacterium]